ncbi:hypothetical protein FOZ62_013788, partial [Perkinsus olseni]
AGDAVDVNTFMGFLTREVAVPEVTQCRTKNGANPLAATIEIDADGRERMRYLAWPKGYTAEESEAEIPAPSTPTNPRRGPGFESSARVNYGGFRNAGGDRTATHAPPTSAVPTSPIATETTAQIPNQNRQRNLSRPRTTFKTSIRTPGFPHRDRDYHFKTSITHGAVDGQEREADRSIDRVFHRPAEDDDNDRDRGAIPPLPQFNHLPSFLEIGPIAQSTPVPQTPQRKAVRPMKDDPVYRDWYFWVDIDYTVDDCPPGEDCSVAEHLDCGGVENTLYVATWWGGKKDARVRIDDSIMNHCGGPLGASRVVSQRELPLDPANPLSCAPVTTPIINAGPKSHIVVAYCGPEFKERHEVRCDASIWAQHFAYGWGDSDNSGLDIPADLVKACAKATVQRIDNLHTLISASLKGATIMPGNDGDNFKTKRQLKLSFQVAPYRYEPSVFHYECERVSTAVEIPELPGAPAVASVRALCDFDESHKAFVKLECPEASAVAFAVKWGGFSKRVVGLGPEIMSHSTKIVRGSEDLGPAISATMDEDRGNYYLQAKDTPGYFICDKADAKIEQTKDLQFAVSVSRPSHFVDSRTQSSTEPRLAVYFDDPYAAIGFLVRWGRVTDAEVNSYYASEFTLPAPRATVENSLPEIRIDNHTCKCPAKAPVVHSPKGEARVTFSSKPLIAVRYKDRMVAMAAAMIAGHRLSEIVLDTAITHHVTHVGVGDNVYMGKEEEHPLKRVALLISGDTNTVHDHIIEVLRPDLVAGPLEDFGVRRYHPVAYSCGQYSLVAVDGLVFTAKCEEGELPQGPHHHYAPLLANIPRKPVEIALTFDDPRAVEAFVAFWKDSPPTANDGHMSGEAELGLTPSSLRASSQESVTNGPSKPAEDRLNTALREQGRPEGAAATPSRTPPGADNALSVAGNGTDSVNRGTRRHFVRHNINNANKYRMRASLSE